MKDLNKSKMVKGAQVENKELGELSPNLVPSSHQHQTIAVAMKDLHSGHEQKPLRSLAAQMVQEGKSGSSYEPRDGAKPLQKLAKEKLKQGSRNPKGMGRSIAKMEMAKQKAKSMK